MTQTISQYIESLGLTYDAVFIPQSESRNAGEKYPSINWKVSIGKGNSKLTTDYMQGAGYIPLMQHMGGNGWEKAYAQKVCENGRYLPVLPTFTSGKVDFYKAHEKINLGYSAHKKLPAPKLIDVLHSLVMDSSVINYSDFAEWASEYGYDADSRKAEKTYNDCLKIALSFRAIVGNDAIEKLSELLNDY